MATNKSSAIWPSKPKEYDSKGIIKQDSTTKIILAHCKVQKMDVICKIKNIDAMWDNSDQTKVDKYFARIKKLSSVQNKHVLSPLHTFHSGKETWMILPQINGGPLKELLHNDYCHGIHNETVIATILHDVAIAIDALHSANLVHRNLCSSSLHMCKDTGKTFLANFDYLKECKRKHYQKRKSVTNEHRHIPKVMANLEKVMVGTFEYDPLVFKAMQSPKKNKNNNTPNHSKRPNHTRARTTSFFHSNSANKNKKRRFSHGQSPSITPITPISPIPTKSPKNTKKRVSFKPPKLAKTQQISEAYFAGFDRRNYANVVCDRKSFIDPLMLQSNNSESGCNWFDSDIYSFGVLAMELYFGKTPPNYGNSKEEVAKRASINDYKHSNCRKLSMNFQDLIEKCTAPIYKRITTKKILSHPFFKKKCAVNYNAVKRILTTLDATHTRIHYRSLARRISDDISNCNSMHSRPTSARSNATACSITKSIAFDYDTVALMTLHSDIDDDDDEGSVFYDNEEEVKDNSVISLEQKLMNICPKKWPKMEDSVVSDHNACGDDADDDDDMFGDLVIDKIKTSDEFVSEISNEFTILPLKMKVSPSILSDQLITPLSSVGGGGCGGFAQSSIVRLNVGGVLYQTSVATLQKYNSILFKLVHSKCVYDSYNNSFFIDRDGTHFGIILNFMRNGKIMIPSTAQNSNDSFKIYKELYQEALYYELHDFAEIVNPNNVSFYSKILPSDDTEYVDTLKEWISEKFGSLEISESDDVVDVVDDDDESKSSVSSGGSRARCSVNDSCVNQKWKLIYRASDDGFQSSAFHRNCDMRGSTVTLIHANDRIFGGYTDIPWKSSGENGDTHCATNDECKDTFIFLMNKQKKNGEIDAEKWNFSMKYYSSFGDNLPVTHDKNYGATFSNIKNAECDKGIVITNDCDVNNGSCWEWCSHYDTPKTVSDLAGSKHFFVSDIEVYQITFDM